MRIGGTSGHQISVHGGGLKDHPHLQDHERANIFIVCNGAIGNSPEMFRNFIFLLFAGGCWPSQVSEGNKKIVSSKFEETTRSGQPYLNVLLL